MDNFIKWEAVSSWMVPLTIEEKREKRKYLAEKIWTVNDNNKLKEFIINLLDENDSSVEDIILDIYELSENSMSQNSQWDLIADGSTRLRAKKLLLELTGVHKWKTVEIKTDFLQLVYWW